MKKVVTIADKSDIRTKTARLVEMLVVQRETCCTAETTNLMDLMIAETLRRLLTAAHPDEAEAIRQSTPEAIMLRISQPADGIGGVR